MMARPICSLYSYISFNFYMSSCTHSFIFILWWVKNALECCSPTCSLAHVLSLIPSFFFPSFHTNDHLLFSLFLKMHRWIILGIPSLYLQCEMHSNRTHSCHRCIWVFINTHLSLIAGAGMFVTTVVVGAVTVTKPFTLTKRPFLRDIIFYIAAVFWTFYLLWHNTMTLYHAVGFVLLYVLYVVVVIVGRLVFQRWKRWRNKDKLGTGDMPSKLKFFRAVLSVQLMFVTLMFVVFVCFCCLLVLGGGEVFVLFFLSHPS